VNERFPGLPPLCFELAGRRPLTDSQALPLDYRRITANGMVGLQRYRLLIVPDGLQFIASGTIIIKCLFGI